MLFNNIGVFTVFYNCVRFRYHHSFNLYVFTCSLNENTAHAVCTARVRFMMEQLRRSVKAAVIFYSYSIKCIIDSDIWLSHKLLPMCSTNANMPALVLILCVLLQQIIIGKRWQVSRTAFLFIYKKSKNLYKNLPTSDKISLNSSKKCQN